MDAAEETWVAVADFGWGGEAEAAEALLRSESIPCYLKNETVLRLEWPLRDSKGGNLSLMVPSSFADQAREILASRVSAADLEAQAERSESE